MKRFMLCIAIGLFYMGASAQSDSLLIDTILVKTTLHSSPHIAVINPANTSENLTQSLQSEEAIYIKNYGGMSLATLSIRGSSASQTGVYWNNLSISNNMLGLLDLSLIPSGFNEKTSMVYGSESTTYGSGNIGGGIYLENKPNKSIILSSSIGSFNNYSTNAILGFGKKLKSSVKFNFQQFKNDYPYTLENGEQRRLINGDGRQAHFMYNSLFTSGKNSYGFNYWFSLARRNIPYTTRQTSGNDATLDLNNRLNFNFERNYKNSKIEWNAGYFTNVNQFFQSELINSNIDRSLQNRLTFRKIFNQSQYSIGVDQNMTSGNSGNYNTRQEQFRIALFGSASLRTRIINIDLRFRQEMIDLNLVPFIPEISLSRSFFGISTLGIKANRVYRYPTLNDLFWIPGGNADLLPEIGWAGEAYNTYRINRERYDLELGISVYNRIVDNWIQWTLAEGEVFFRPLNVNKVWSRGIEFKSNLEVDLNSQWKLKHSFAYNLNRSTYQESLTVPLINKGDQLFYTPIHQLNNTLKIKYQKSSINYTYRYFSESRGLNENVDQYALNDLRISQQLNFNLHTLDVSFAINNIANSSYRIIEFRPMPGRNYQLNITYKLN